MSTISSAARVLWALIKGETVKEANTAARVGGAGLKLVDAIEERMLTSDYVADGKFKEELLPATGKLIKLNNDVPTYTVSLETASSISVINAADAGAVVLPVLAADKLVSIQILRNNTLVLGESFSSGTTIYAAFNQVEGVWNISYTKPVVVSVFKQGSNGFTYPQIFKYTNNLVVTSVKLMTNCAGLSVTIAGVTYTHATLVGVALLANTEMIVNDLTITAGQTNANALIIF